MKIIGYFLTFLLIALVFDAVTGFSSTIASSPTVLTPLGTFSNFPCGSPDCSQNGLNPCSFGANRLDTCELFNSTLHRAEYSPAGISTVLVPFYIGFEVGCVSPAVPTAAGSVLYLQYANYSLVTYLNTTKFVTANGVGSIYIDNTNGWPCPGNLESDAMQQINAPPAGQGVQFRVIGICGCGFNGSPINGGNPILSYVRVKFGQQIRNSITSSVLTRGTTTFRYEALTNLPVTSATTINIDWIASNQTTICAVGDACIQEGTSSCIIPIASTQCPLTTVTFVNAFGGTPSVIVQVLNNPNVFTAIITTGGLSMFETDLRT